MHWLTQFLDKLFSVIPRLWLIDPDEAGVRVTLGKYVKELGSGWYICLPMIQTCEKIKVVTQVEDLRPQSVRTSDGKEIVISGAVKYRVSSAKDAILGVYDYDANIKTLALGIIFDYVTSRPFGELNTTTLKNEILKGLRDASRGWGLKIEAIYLTDIGAVRNLRLLLSEPIINVRGEED